MFRQVVSSAIRKQPKGVRGFSSERGMRDHPTVRNVAAGVVLAGFVVGVYSYTVHSIKLVSVM